MSVGGRSPGTTQEGAGDESCETDRKLSFPADNMSLEARPGKEMFCTYMVKW